MTRLSPTPTNPEPPIARHRAAIGRSALSRPLRLAREAGLLEGVTRALDYGCGRGDDVRALRELGLSAAGWDPHYFPDVPREPAPLVHLGYVLNVIEDPAERVATLDAAFSLAEDVLLVAALVEVQFRGGAQPWGDGVRTRIHTFQRYFRPVELQGLLRERCGIEPVALGPGVWAIVRDGARRAELMARGLRPARGAGDEAAREALRAQLALWTLHGGVQLDALAPDTQRQIRRLFGGVRAARAEGLAMLRRLGDMDALRSEARRAGVGKCMPEALYVHRSALSELPVLLRLVVACAASLVGPIEDAEVLKIRLDKPGLSWLYYPAFDVDAHPALAMAVRIDLRTFALDGEDYRASVNPPILHRKELFVGPEYPNRARFARLTTQEERWGLYDGSTGAIGTRAGWERRLRAAGVEIRGHRVFVASTQTAGN